MASVFKLPDVNVYVCVSVCVCGGGGGGRNNVFTLLKRLLFLNIFFHYTYDFMLLPLSFTVSLSVHVFSCNWN